MQTAPLALDQACWVNAAEAAASVQSASPPTLADVRPRSLQRAAPIARALQLELSDMASKRFLQQTSVVLLGSGSTSPRLTRPAVTAAARLCPVASGAGRCPSMAGRASGDGR
ncbi:hypothetical protein [Comamonas sp. JC664]|uniref:hypothetical protein n=1 Tax=Comamonas sp. JC664 TaxID=2801917 RepID=UPI00360CA188